MVSQPSARLADEPLPCGMFTLGLVDLVLAMSPTAKCMGLLLFSGVAAPLAGVLFRRVAGGWDSIGKGPLAIDPDLPQGRAKELFSPGARSRAYVSSACATVCRADCRVAR